MKKNVQFFENVLLFSTYALRSIYRSKYRKMAFGYILWRLSLIRKESVTWDRPERFTVILDSYKRPWNMQSIALTMLRCAFVEKVIVTNNNPDVLISDYVVVQHPKLVLMNQSNHCGADVRYLIAAQEPGMYFIAVDDDLFLRPSQLAVLAEELIKNPAVPHGMFGTIIEQKEDDIVLVKGQWGFNGSVDIIQRAYFFTKQHAVQFHRVVERLVRESLMTRDDVSLYEDILLSISGEQRPLCHNVGPFAECFTSSSKGIAMYQTDGLRKKRKQFLLNLRTVDKKMKDIFSGAPNAYESL